LVEIDIKQYNQTGKLNRLIDSLHLTDNIIEIIKEATELLHQKINCDSINILFNNEKSRHFYINQTLNHADHENGDVLNIPYNETTITEILRSHRSVIRNDLSLRGGLTPGDLKFLAEGINSDLSVPVIHQNKVLAVINLSSFETNYFSEAHQVETEQIASLLGLALGRIELMEKLEGKKSELLLWKNKFKSLINNMSEPVAIVGDDYDLIYETNVAFQKLTGYSAEDLDGMRLSNIHGQNEELILTNLDKSPTNGNTATIEQIILSRKNGTQFSVSLKFVPVDKSLSSFVYAIYERMPETREAITKSDDTNDTENEFNLQQVAVFNTIVDLANSEFDFNDFIKSAVLAVQKIVDFDFAQVTLFDSAGEHVDNHTIISNQCRNLD